MPSYAPQSSYASASSSRHAEHASSHSRSSRSHRHSDDSRTRPRSPDARHHDHSVDADKHRSSEYRRDDDRRSSHRPPYISRHADERDYPRGRHPGWSPPPRDHRYPAHEARDSVEYDRYGPIRQRSPGPRRYRSPETSLGWDDHSRDSDRGASRRSKDDRDARRPSISSSAYKNSDRRSDRSPDRSHTSHRDRETDRKRRSGDYEAAHRRDGHRESRRSGRSRSRSRDRSRPLDSSDDRRSATEDRHVHASKRDERSDYANGSRPDAKLLKRQITTEASSQLSKQSLLDDQAEEGAIPDPVSSSDHGDDRLERLASASNRAPNGNDRTSSTYDGSRHRHRDNNTSQSRPPSKANGHAPEPSRLDRSHAYIKERRRSRSPPSNASAPRPQSSTSVPPGSQPVKSAPRSSTLDAASRPAPKEAVNKRSFGHVLLPHELPAELRGKNKLAVASSDSASSTVLKSAVEKQLVDAKTIDPRKGSYKTRHYRNALYKARFTWDDNSVGTKPLPPPRNLVLTNLSALTQPAQLLIQLRPFGRIESSKLEINPKIGQSLGIFCVTFAHDFDEHGKVLDSVTADQTPQNATNAAKAAQQALNGRVIGQARVVALLDRDGEVVSEKVKEKMAAEEKQAADEAKLKRPVPATTAPHVGASPGTPSATKPNMPSPHIPRGPRASTTAAASPSVSSSSASTRPITERYESSSSRYSRYGSSSEDARKTASTDPHNRRRDTEDYDSHRSRPHTSRQPQNSACSPSPARAKAEQKPKKLKTEEIINTLRNSERPFVFIPKPKLCDIETADVEAHLESTPPLWIREGDAGWYAAYGKLSEANACKLVNETLTIGGFTLQVDVRPAPSKYPRTVEPKKPHFSGGAPPSANGPRAAAPVAAAAQPRKTLDTGLRPLTAEEKQKTDWTAAQLQDAVFRMLQKELADTFIRDVKSRLVAPHLTSYLRPDQEGGQILAKAVIKKPKAPSKTVDRIPTMSRADAEARLPSFRRVAVAKPKKMASDSDAKTSKARRDTAKSTKEREAVRKSKSHHVRGESESDDESEDTERNVITSDRRESRTKSKPATKKRGPASWLMVDSDEEAESDDAAATEQDATSRSVSASVEPATAEQNEDEVVVSKGNKRPKVKAENATKKKAAAAAKKGAGALEVDREADQGEETATPEADIPTKAVKGKPKSTKASAKNKPIPTDPFEAGLVQDAEDCYYLRLALEHLRKTGELPSEETWRDEVELEAEAEERALAAGALPKHSTGSAKTEGYYRIPPEQKAMHLPDRNKATEEADTTTNAHILQSARNNRADSRRLVLGIEQHKRETATDTDIFKFNQLRTRKKQLKFAKSPIHDWGLYAMEFIPAGDMVIEYVGEVVRQQVADEREKQYERQGNFSTYLFRVDDDLVVDATHKGNIARLMNHCCTPNCNAKILTLNGEKRIVLFAKTAIRAGEELTYDYKFQSSADDEDAIPCLCGSPGCRRFL
ncbi:related to Histone-lysine N-methyltransferase, H3 lysine-4 specific [Ustilago trichophora]|uniref:Histone-lysine N-methyltransferase, H3 lysine-4 specific n=1 Tax=Ustilago trichophora TaxID=86804 RepID=A0A5C3E4D7_9BASI|nr:related to Histone-lysine N-methyltransferase, H3 lysine-4 specific [Ustilago trichophora]